jgi:NAD(P)-dependent dehydrogenase (short-subunit alcohol dehydrogenase family)
VDYYQDKIAIVTGGASGIGRAMCQYICKRGGTVIIADRNLDGAISTQKEITESGGSAYAKEVDVTNPDMIQALVHEVVGEYGRIDFLFNNAGISVNGEFQDISEEYWRKIMDVNFWGVYYGTKYVYPVMKQQGNGHIINTASLAGLIPGGLTTSYSASKHAVVGFTQTLRSEAKQYGIRVTTLCPGFVKTHIQETTENVSDYLNAEKNKEMEADAGKLTPEDIIGQIMKGVRKNKAVIVTPRRHKIYWYLYRLFPGMIPYMFDKIIKRMKNNALITGE